MDIRLSCVDICSSVTLSEIIIILIIMMMHYIQQDKCVSFSFKFELLVLSLSVLTHTLVPYISGELPSTRKQLTNCCDLWGSHS